MNPIQTINRPLMECYPEVADDEDEQLLADVRRHWLGKTAILITSGFIVLALLLLAVFTPKIIESLQISDSATLVTITWGIALLVIALVAIGTFISLWVYNQSRMLITNENVIELKQTGLFSHSTSHLNMINVEDVTVQKKGIFQTMFNFGTLTIQTAGEEDNFQFVGTPNPDQYRRIVIRAHEQAIERVGQMGQGQRTIIADNKL